MPEDRRPQLRESIQTRLRVQWQEWIGALAHVGDEVAPMLRVGADLIEGGKRLRASFADAGWRAAGGASEAESIVHLGCGLELFQVAAVVHDDLIDGSLTRRGKPAAHRQLAAHHADAGLQGDADRFGETGAVLLGDLLLVAAQRELELAFAGAVTAQAATKARSTATLMMAEVTAGQFLDGYAQVAPWRERSDHDCADPDLDRAFRVIRSKAARYSVEHPLVIGAQLAGADDDLVAQLSGYGLPVGEAFQLRDDVLGVFGDPATTGKPAGDDLREGKRTIMVAIAMSRADDADRSVLRRGLGDPTLSEAQIESMRTLLRSTGALDAVEELIARRHDDAVARLHRAALPEQVAADLVGLAGAATARSA